MPARTSVQTPMAPMDPEAGGTTGSDVGYVPGLTGSEKPIHHPANDPRPEDAGFIHGSLADRQRREGTGIPGTPAFIIPRTPVAVQMAPPPPAPEPTTEP